MISLAGRFGYRFTEIGDISAHLEGGVKDPEKGPSSNERNHVGRMN